MQIKYQKSEISKIIIFSMVFLIMFIQLSFFYNIGEKPLNGIAYLVLTVLLVLILLTFYKLTITIDEYSIKAYFGLGLIKREFQISEIDFDSIEKIKLSWLNGIGLRITPKGILYNTKIGSAIYFKSKDKTKTFFVGTDDFEEIRKILLEHEK